MIIQLSYAPEGRAVWFPTGRPLLFSGEVRYVPVRDTRLDHPFDAHVSLGWGNGEIRMYWQGPIHYARAKS